jgi:alpha-methylacyl-CoA racemase
MVDGLMMMFLNVTVYTRATCRHGETITTGLYPWYSVYEAADGKFVSVGAIEPWFYENLCRLLECEEYVTEQYADGARREEIFESFRRIFKTRPRDEWVSLLMPAETCVAPVTQSTKWSRTPTCAGAS